MSLRGITRTVLPAVALTLALAGFLSACKGGRQAEPAKTDVLATAPVSAKAQAKGVYFGARASGRTGEGRADGAAGTAGVVGPRSKRRRAAPRNINGKITGSSASSRTSIATPRSRWSNGAAAQ
jgi:hypothetical protein